MSFYRVCGKITCINLFILFFCLCFLGCTESTRQSENVPEIKIKPLVIATWNVHNLFDVVCDSGECGSGQYERVLSEDDYREKILEVANALKGSGADVLLLQEFEKESCLQDVLAETPLYKDYIFGEIGRASSVDVAIVSRYPIKSTKMYREGTEIQLNNGTYKIARELIEAEIALPDGKILRAFVTHLISKASDPDGVRRIPEAHIVSEIIKKSMDEHPEDYYAFGGDMNDTPDSTAIQTIEAESGLLDSTRDYPANSKSTWSNQSRLDYIFINPLLRGKQKSSEIVCNYNGKGYSGSDHCMYKAEFNL